MALSGGGTITAIGARASPDGQHIFAACAATVRIYSALTSALLAELRGHTEDVTAIALDPNSPTKVYSASLDGTVRHWEVSEGKLLQTFAVNAPVKSLVVPAQGVHAYVVTAHATGHNKGRVMRLSTVTGAVDPRAIATSKPRALAVSQSGGYVSTVDKHTVHVWSTQHPEWPSLKLHSTKALTCVALDAREERIAAGDVSGRIHIWNGFGSAVAAAAGASSGGASDQPGQPGQAGRKRDVRDANLAKETLHWHAAAVSSLAFSTDGTYLLSGGREAVLVIWRLDSGAKTFLPRLQGALTAINPSPSDAACYVVTQADNTIRLVNTAAMRVACSIHGLRPPVKGVPKTVAVLVPGTGELALAGEGALLQIFDPSRNRHIDKVQVGHRNPASTKTLDAAAADEPGVPIHISHLAFSAEGASMATVDVHPSASASSAVGCSLKFWDRRASGASAGGQPLYSLNSHVPDPHRSPVTGLAYSPREHMAASVSGDGRLAIWQRIAAKGGPSAAHMPSTTWRCFSTSTYRDEPMSAVAFSGDGSLVAVAMPGSVTLWDPAANSLVAVLAHPPAASSVAVSSLSFVAETPYLVGVSTDPQSQCVVVWNLITASVWWSAATPASCLAVDAKSGAFAVALPREPVRRWTHRLPQPQAQPKAAISAKGETAGDATLSSAGDAHLNGHSLADEGAEPMEVDAADGELQGPEQLAALRGGVFWLDPPSSQSQASEHQQQQRQQRPSTEQQQRGGSKGGGVDAEGAQKADSSAAVAQTSDGAKQAEGSFMYGGGGGSVLLFDAGVPCPRAAWLLPRCPVAALAFLEQDSATAGKLKQAGTGRPLLILTEDRQYHIAHPGAAADAVSADARAELTIAQGSAKGGWEAAFGPLKPQQRALEQRKQAPDAGEGLPKVEDLWDAPSHALPAPSMLVGASLEALLGSAA
ncbi:g2829 [Coccomyxa viridis]|uniref:G2829 protein n=1 Tax=Coccomyxa viridis TaxID=1274662 RepID=A0ABP1FLC0_9CHLO